MTNNPWGRVKGQGWSSKIGGIHPGYKQGMQKHYSFQTCSGLCCWYYTGKISLFSSTLCLTSEDLSWTPRTKSLIQIWKEEFLPYQKSTAHPQHIQLNEYGFQHYINLTIYNWALHTFPSQQMQQAHNETQSRLIWNLFWNTGLFLHLHTQTESLLPWALLMSKRRVYHMNEVQDKDKTPITCGCSPSPTARSSLHCQ